MLVIMPDGGALFPRRAFSISLFEGFTSFVNQKLLDSANLLEVSVAIIDTIWICNMIAISISNIYY